MFKVERQVAILDFIYKKGNVSVNSMSAFFKISKETIRKDLNDLHKIGLIKRTHGGAIAVKKNIINEFKDIDSLLQITQSIAELSIIKEKRELSMKGKVFILGSYNVDIVTKVTKFPKVGETVVGTTNYLSSGGKGANQAISASNAGSDVRFVTKIGRDQFSDFAYKNLHGTNINSFSIFQSESEPTGNALIYVSEENKDNMIAIFPGANKTITEDELNSVKLDITNSDVLLVQLENNFDIIQKALEYAKENGVLTILNPAPYNAITENFIGLVDIITPNKTEASLLSGIEIKDFATAKNAAIKINEMGFPIVIITMGEEGALLYENKQFTSFDVYPAIVVDTTGAGDAFNGALASQLSKGVHIHQSIKFASAFSSLAIERDGASNMPTEKETNDKLNRFHPN